MADLKEIEKQLRELIDQRHREAHASVDQMLKNVTGPSISKGDVNRSNGSPPTIVEQVLSVIDDRHKDVRSIVIETGLNADQVRGVLYTPNMDKRIQSKKVGAKMMFQKRQESTG